MTKLTSAALKNLCIKILKDNKGIAVKALCTKKLTDITDYMIICTSNSTIHTKTLVEKLRERLAEEHIKPIGVEGEDTREWMLIDFGDVIVHVMLANIRELYSLEELWTIEKAATKKTRKTV